MACVACVILACRLQANDAQFKELLRRVVAMDVWPKARNEYVKEWVGVVGVLLDMHITNLVVLTPCFSQWPGCLVCLSYQ